jgi:hypothetical protein
VSRTTLATPCDCNRITSHQVCDSGGSESLAFPPESHAVAFAMRLTGKLSRSVALLLGRDACDMRLRATLRRATPRDLSARYGKPRARPYSWARSSNTSGASAPFLSRPRPAGRLYGDRVRSLRVAITPSFDLRHMLEQNHCFQPPHLSGELDRLLVLFRGHGHCLHPGAVALVCRPQQYAGAPTIRKVESSSRRAPPEPATADTERSAAGLKGPRAGARFYSGPGIFITVPGRDISVDDRNDLMRVLLNIGKVLRVTADTTSAIRYREFRCLLRFFWQSDELCPYSVRAMARFSRVSPRNSGRWRQGPRTPILRFPGCRGRSTREAFATPSRGEDWADCCHAASGSSGRRLSGSAAF